MNKKLIIIISILVVLITLISVYFFSNRTIKLSDNYNFKKIYNSPQDMENIEIKILNIQYSKTTDISNKADISDIINMIKNEKITPNVGLGEATLGKSYLFSIKNKYNNNSVNIDITSNQMSVNNKNYSTENNLLENLADICSKYYK